MYTMQYNNNTKAVNGVCVLITPDSRNFKLLILNLGIWSYYLLEATGQSTPNKNNNKLSMLYAKEITLLSYIPTSSYACQNY